MPKNSKHRSRKIGLPPGALIHIGEKKIEKTRIEFFDFDETHFQAKVVQNIDECFPFKDTSSVTWINIDGLHDIETIEKIGNHFDIHHLILEDILHTGQRPKFEDFGSYIYIVLRMFSYENDEHIKEEQISIILGTNFVISFQEDIGDIFDPLRERIRSGKFQIKKRNADYLAYSLIDAVVDNYFIILEKLGEKIETLEEELLDNPSPVTLQTIHQLRHKLITLRKSIWPLREVISRLERGESSLFDKSTIVYLKDVHDHTIQVIDTIETFRDMASGMLDIYLSNMSNKMNEVMKVLTVIATIFIPLTFIVGIYGMNFEFMPELKWHLGYPLIWSIMIIVALGMMFYFHRKKWF
jgi:magnesium transporter